MQGDAGESDEEKMSREDGLRRRWSGMGEQNAVVNGS
jgi:hypothetical protein